MTREQLDLLLALLAIAGGLIGLPLAILHLLETGLDVNEKLARRGVNLRCKKCRVG